MFHSNTWQSTILVFIRNNPLSVLNPAYEVISGKEVPKLEFHTSSGEFHCYLRFVNILNLMTLNVIASSWPLDSLTDTISAGVAGSSFGFSLLRLAISWVAKLYIKWLHKREILFKVTSNHQQSLSMLDSE